MESNPLYYTFSTIPQVSVAISAIIYAYTYFRIATLTGYLIGDGISVLNRWGEKGYKLPNPEEDQKQRKRLRDAIDRKSISEIKHVISQLSQIEESEGHSKKERPTGLQYVYEDRFCGTEYHISRLKRLTLYVIVLSLTSTFVSILSLASTDSIISFEYFGLKYIAIWLNVALFLVSLVPVVYLLFLGLSEGTVHETDRQL